MNPNSEVYGAPETWINSKNFAGMTTAIAELIHAKRAQICGTWIDPSQPEYDSYEKGSLQWGILGGKIIAQQPIDKSITAIGQGRDSAYHRLGVYANQQREGEENPQIRRIGTATYDTNVLNFAAFDARCPTSSAVYANRAFNQRYNFKKSSELVWSPDGAYHRGTSTMNGTFNISPFTYYESRTILLQIIVSVTDLTTAELEANPPTSPPAVHTYNLETWKNDYSNHSITAAFISMRYLNSYDTATGDMQYRLASYGSSTYQKAAFMCLDKLTIAEDGGTNTDIYHYGMYADSSNVARIVLFQPQTGLSKWDNSNELVALMPFDHVFGNTIQFGSTQVWYQIPYSDDAYEAIMGATACFGCPFTPSKATTTNSNITFNQSFTDADMCLPIILENGVADGDYTRGTDNVNNPFIELKTPYEYEYDPYTPTPVDTNTYSITTGFNTVGNVASTTKQYVINANALQGLSGELWSVVGNLITNPDDIKNLDNLSLDAFLTSNPIDAIVSVKKFPLSSVPHGENLENICLGKYQTSAAGYTLALQQARYNFEGIPIFPKFGNCFLDYSPYTKMQLYVPFCGTIDIDAADFMGRTLSVEMVIDFITGSVTAYVLANQLVVTSLTGTCAIDIPITGTEQATVNSAYESATIAERQARKNEIMQTVGIFTHPIKTATKPLTTAAERVSTALDRAQREYELTHINMPLRQIGQASPLNSWALEFVCRLIIYYPDGECISFNATNEPTLITDKVQAFGTVNGFATVETDTLSGFTGFTQVSDADLTGISATDTEKEMILSLLQSGIYL